MNESRTEDAPDANAGYSTTTIVALRATSASSVVMPLGQVTVRR